MASVPVSSWVGLRLPYVGQAWTCAAAAVWGQLLDCITLVFVCWCRGAAAAIIVYDITSTDSFNRAKAWVRELQRQGSPNMIMALAGGPWLLVGGCPVWWLSCKVALVASSWCGLRLVADVEGL